MERARAAELVDRVIVATDSQEIFDVVIADEVVRRGDQAARGLIVLSDTGDTVFGGSSGDSNLILESILRLKIQSPVLMPLIEPPTVAALVAAGEGATVTLGVGGHSAPKFFRPLTVTGRVGRIHRGMVPLRNYYQSEIDMSTTVVFQVGPVTMLVSEYRGVAGNLQDVYAEFMGIDPKQYKMAVLKTASNFQYFKALTSEVIRVDTTGPGQSDVFTLPWSRIPRPVYPLDPIDDWRRVGT